MRLAGWSAAVCQAGTEYSVAAKPGAGDSDHRAPWL